MKFAKNIAIALVAVAGMAGAASAASAGKAPEKQAWSFEGPTGKYDQAALQRGWQVYQQVCSACHGLKYFRFRNLAEMGYGEDMIKAFAKEYEITDGLDSEGDPLVRPGLPQDAFPSPFPNDVQAANANGGALPPDLSLMTKARHDGPNYVFSLMTGYEDAPAGYSLPAGKAYNPYFKGGAISMIAPLSDGLLEYEDGTEATAEQMARDVTQFLMYVAEPKLEDRKQMGMNVILFLLALTVIFYISMKKIWKPVKEGKNVYEDE